MIASVIPNMRKADFYPGADFMAADGAPSDARGNPGDTGSLDGGAQSGAAWFVVALIIGLVALRVLYETAGGGD